MQDAGIEAPGGNAGVRTPEHAMRNIFFPKKIMRLFD